MNRKYVILTEFVCDGNHGVNIAYGDTQKDVRNFIDDILTYEDVVNITIRVNHD